LNVKLVVRIGTGRVWKANETFPCKRRQVI